MDGGELGDLVKAFRPLSACFAVHWLHVGVWAGNAQTEGSTVEDEGPRILIGTTPSYFCASASVSASIRCAPHSPRDGAGLGGLACCALSARCARYASRNRNTPGCSLASFSDARAMDAVVNNVFASPQQLCAPHYCAEQRVVTWRSCFCYGTQLFVAHAVVNKMANTGRSQAAQSMLKRPYTRSIHSSALPLARSCGPLWITGLFAQSPVRVRCATVTSSVALPRYPPMSRRAVMTSIFLCLLCSLI